jgi:hypothetical protein
LLLLQAELHHPTDFWVVFVRLVSRSSSKHAVGPPLALGFTSLRGKRLALPDGPQHLLLLLGMCNGSFVLQSLLLISTRLQDGGIDVLRLGPPDLGCFFF